jgi:hypothetical protein
MSAKTIQQKSGTDPFRYEPADLVLPDTAADEADLAAFLERNGSALEASAERARGEFERGACCTLDQMLADVEVQRQRRRGSKP